MGERQKGRNDLKLASLRRDKEWVELAREVAVDVIDADPELEARVSLELGIRIDHELEAHPGLADEIALLLGDDEAEFLMKS